MSECQICSTRGRPQEAEFGQLCDRCANGLLRTLNDVELCTLAISAVPGQAGSSEPIASSKPESKSPANDTAIMHLDPRTAWSAEDGYGAFAVLAGWAEVARSELGIEQPTRITVTTEATALRMAHRHVCEQLWCVEMAEELQGVQRRVRQLCGLSADKPVGPCPDVDCGGRSYTTIDRIGVECRKCKTVFRAADMIEMSRTKDRRLISRAELAEIMAVTERVIRRRFEVATYIGNKSYYDLDDCFTKAFDNN